MNEQQCPEAGSGQHFTVRLGRMKALKRPLGIDWNLGDKPPEDKPPGFLSSSVLRPSRNEMLLELGVLATDDLP